MFLFLPFLPMVAEGLRVLQPDMAKLTAQFHIAFNVTLAIMFLPLLDPLAWALQKMFPARLRTDDPSAPRYLDESALDTPSLALGDAARETLRMGDAVEVMLRQVMKALMTDDRSLVAEVSRMDNIVDRLDEAIKLYLTKLTRGSLDEREGKRRWRSFPLPSISNISAISSIKICASSPARIKRKIQFSAEGAAELAAFHKRILDSLRVAFSVFMSGEVSDARKLISEKTQVRNEELLAAERHFERLREGRPETIETTSLHLDVLRDLKRIHSHICSVAYPVLEASGEMVAADIIESDPITLAVPGTKSTL